jgi:hypothetical protein
MTWSDNVKWLVFSHIINFDWPSFPPNKHKIYLREAMTAFFSTFLHIAMLSSDRKVLRAGLYGNEIQTVQLWDK